MEITNKKARYDYDIEETVEAGIVLKGTEIKSIRNGKAQLKDSYAILKNNEVYLLNMHISEYDHGNIFNHNETRTRKLLLHKKEILKCFQRLRKIKKLSMQRYDKCVKEFYTRQKEFTNLTFWKKYLGI